MIEFSRNRFKGVRETSGLVNMKNKVLPKITNISAIVDIVGAVAFFIVQIINAAKRIFDSECRGDNIVLRAPSRRYCGRC